MRKRQQGAAVGVLNVDKPGGLTSHDVVARVRRLPGAGRVGHAGTLDPLATGVLLVCVGAATRIVSYLQAGRKVYRARFRLGESTDTYDADGKVLSIRPVPDLDVASLRQALQTFAGEQAQMPPMYSALKREGRPLYRLARAGQEVERSPRAVVFYELDLEVWQPPDMTVRLSCSPGTYVRSLAHDLGELLGCGAHVRSLRRLASGAWRVEEAVTLEALQAAGDGWTRYLHGLAAALSALPALILPADLARRFALGQKLALVDAGLQAAVQGEVRVMDPAEQLVGIGVIDPQQGVLAPHRVFASPEQLDSSL